jgi:transposase
MPISFQESIRNRFNALSPHLNEKHRRLWCASEAKELGHGGINAVSAATGMSQKTIRSGLKDLSEPAQVEVEAVRVRKPGGGRKKATEQNPELLVALEALLEPYTIGDPMRPLRWTSKSTQNLSDELRKQGHKVSARTVASLLKELGYGLQSNYKRNEGKGHPDRDAQFEYINTMAEAFQSRSSPVISVDAKKKELIGNFKNAGQEWQKQGAPLEVEAYDFIDLSKGKVTPYGVYDTTLNLGWVSVGTDNDTAQFAASSVSHWWSNMGEFAYPEARELLIFADGGGSNGSRNRLWKKSLQELSDREDLKIVVCHFPPGTSKWNKIEHRMFCHITQNWRGKPLISHEVVVSLIGATKTNTGLAIQAQLDETKYPKGLKVSDGEMESLNIETADFHGEWNYMISPREKPQQNR